MCLQDTLSDFKSHSSTIGGQLEALEKSITKRDASVAKTMRIRRDERAEFLKVTANNAAASKLLGPAVNCWKDQ